jgi:hypothetical protein
MYACFVNTLNVHFIDVHNSCISLFLFAINLLLRLYNLCSIDYISYVHSLHTLNNRYAFKILLGGYFNFCTVHINSGHNYDSGKRATIDATSVLYYSMLKATPAAK